MPTVEKYDLWDIIVYSWQQAEEFKTLVEKVLKCHNTSFEI